MKAALLLVAIAFGYVLVSNEDYKVAKMAEQERISKNACAPKDYIGRPLVASYHARSDVATVKRCTYRKSA